MPPTRHSNSTAHKDSDELKTNEPYTLGDYSFRIERSSVPGSSNDKIEAICTKDGKNARKSIQVSGSTQLLGWYVEANGETADVYVNLKSAEIVTDFKQPIPSGTSIAYTAGQEPWTYSISLEILDEGAKFVRVTDKNFTWCSAIGGFRVLQTDSRMSPFINTYTTNRSYTREGKTAYYYDGVQSINNTPGTEIVAPPVASPPSNRALTGLEAWSVLYNPDEGGEKLVGRFAIEIEDAGGVGPGSDWTDPGDYDPGWEPGEPTHTLHVEVTGALSGRHNDPLNDPSYSYIPADKDTVKDYGCGGDGGHGGGGGAGASTVVVHKFATNQANSKEVTAIARRHGYGSGGGKGGKGGDGCILIYY